MYYKFNHINFGVEVNDHHYFDKFSVTGIMELGSRVNFRADIECKSINDTMYLTDLKIAVFGAVVTHVSSRSCRYSRTATNSLKLCFGELIDTDDEWLQTGELFAKNIREFASMFASRFCKLVSIEDGYSGERIHTLHSMPTSDINIILDEAQ